MPLERMPYPWVIHYRSQQEHWDRYHTVISKTELPCLREDPRGAESTQFSALRQVSTLLHTSKSHPALWTYPRQTPFSNRLLAANCCMVVQRGLAIGVRPARVLAGMLPSPRIPTLSQGVPPQPVRWPCPAPQPAARRRWRLHLPCRSTRRSVKSPPG